jgi:putative two-component system response regulator
MDKEKQTILIVDDIAENIDVLRYILQPDYNLKVAINGKRALEIAGSSTPPDLILLDIMMPEMDGYEVCRTLKTNIATRKIPVIFITAKSDENDEAEGFEAGGVDYIIKPISPPIVKERVKTHLALYDQNRVLDGLVKQRTAELVETRLEIIQRLGVAAEYKDRETGAHILRMASYCRVIALGSGMSEDEAELIFHAAPMHDVGKIGIPDSILLKPGKLDPEEWEIMKTHTVIGKQIIGHHTSELLQAAGEIAITHHEKWDGSGYPYNLKGKQIHKYGRIAAIADVLDALSSKRPYKEAWPMDKAVQEIIDCAGRHFDPKYVNVFQENLSKILEIHDYLSGE